MKTLLHFVAFPILLGLLLEGCAIDESPVDVPQEAQSYTVRLTVFPPNSLRTEDTWTFWANPVEIEFETTFGDIGGGNGHGHGLGKITDEGDEVTIGTFTIEGMGITVIADHAEDIWIFHHGGEMEERHAEPGERHIEVHVADEATGHHAHGGTDISNCEVKLIAESGVDTFEVPLKPVQSGHGLRYEANAALPYGTYNLTVQAEPPTFARGADKRNHWVQDMEATFSNFVFDPTFTSGTIGNTIIVGSASDSTEITLRAGSVKPYGAVGLGQLPLSGDETINFSVRLEDPTVEAHEGSVFNCSVIINMVNNENGKQVSHVIGPMYSGHGFHYGTNMSMPGGNGHPH